MKDPVPRRVLLRVAHANVNLEDRVHQILEESEMHCVQFFDKADTNPDGFDTVVSVSSGFDHAFHLQSALIATAANVPWLHVGCGESAKVTLGPMSYPKAAPCYECFFAMHLSISRPVLADDLSIEGIAAIAAAIAFTLIAYIRDPTHVSGPRTVLEYDAIAHTTRELLFSRMPGCPNCWPRSMDRQPQNLRAFCLASLFEDCARVRMAPLPTPGYELERFLDKEPHSPRHYDHCEKVELEGWNDLCDRALEADDTTHPKRTALSRIDLAHLLFLAFGRLDSPGATRADRALPTAGNLGSTEAFLIVRDVDGLAPGIYYYENQHHRLARIVRPEGMDPEKLLEACGLAHSSAALPAAVMILSGAYARIGLKYRAFAFRLIHMDAGVALARLKEAGRALHLDTLDLPHWDDTAVEHSMLLRSWTEPVVGAIAFYPTGTVNSSSLNPTSISRAKPTFEATREISSDLSPWELARWLYDVSRSRLCSFQIGHRNGLPDGQFVDPDADPKALSCRAPLSDLWWNTLRRHSHRQVNQRLIELLQAQDILKSVIGIGCKRSTHNLTKLFVSLRCDQQNSAARTLFAYLSPQNEFVEYAKTGEDLPLGEGFVEPSYAEAPLIFWICGNVECEPHQYTQLLVEAGRRAYDVMSVADEHGVGGVITAGIWAHVVSKTLKLKYVDETPLLAFVAGWQNPNVIDAGNEEG